MQPFSNVLGGVKTQLRVGVHRDHGPRGRRSELPPHIDWYLIAEQPAPAPHLAHPEGCAALLIVLVTVPRVSRSCENFPDGFNRQLLL